MTGSVNGYTSPDSATFDNCAYQQAVANATEPGVLPVTLTFPEDSTPPVTAITATPTAVTLGGAATDHWTVSLKCDDPVVGDFAGGCISIEYRVDNGPLTPYREPFTVTGEGQHPLEFHSIDAAANAESFQLRVLAINADPDTDGDGLSDALEDELNTNPLDSDTDDDGLLDNEEIETGTNPMYPDTDFDGILDGAEAAYGTNPLDWDTDDDGLADGPEVAAGTNPLTPTATTTA